MKIRYLLLLLPVVFLQTLCAQRSISAEDYIAKWKDIAIEEMHRSGIPASITLAQGLLESGNGNSELAVKFNNHFGIKCHDWAGNRAYHDDDAKGECFRHYDKAEDSYLDHTDFLMTHKRYAFLFDYGSTDYVQWAKGLRRAGYATAHDYPQRLIDLIKRYKLYLYDKKVKPDNSQPRRQEAATTDSEMPEHSPRIRPPKPRKTAEGVTVSIETYPVKENNRTQYIVAREGDTYAKLSTEFELTVRQLMRYNDSPGDRTLVKGEVVYIEPKRRRAEAGHNTHRLREGEDMRNVSQLYAIKLSRLYALNGLVEGAEPPVGTILNLRKKIRNR